MAQGKGGRYIVVQIEDECTSLTSFALSYKEESTIQTILATVINASVYTISQHPPTQTIDVTHRHSGAPSSIEPLTIPILHPVPCAAYPISPATCVRPDFEIVGVGDFPTFLDTAGEDAGCSTRPTGCPVSSPPGVRQHPSIALIQGLPSLPFPPSTGFGINWVTGIPLQRSCTIARNRAWMNVLNCQCRGCTFPSRRNCSTSFCCPGLLPRTGLKI